MSGSRTEKLDDPPLSSDVSVLSVKKDPNKAGLPKNDLLVETVYSNVRCSDIFTEWRRCISAFHQFHQYYIYGKLSHCKEEKNRMYNCFKWKGLRREDARIALIESLEMEQRNMHSPTSPWKLRESPGDWKH